jgi:hypothetical protein
MTWIPDSGVVLRIDSMVLLDVNVEVLAYRMLFHGIQISPEEPLGECISIALHLSVTMP